MARQLELDTIPASRRIALVMAPRGSGEDVVVDALRKLSFSVLLSRDPYDVMVQFLKNPVKLVVISVANLERRDRPLIRELQRLSPEVRILLMVPEGRKEVALFFLEEGGDGLLNTPCYASEVQHVARALLKGDAADSLTGLPNRDAFRRAFDREQARAKRDGSYLGLGILDLDKFKQVNEDFGYLEADEVLKETARRLREEFRVTDVVARWGGEEFLVLLTALPEDAKAAYERARSTLERARISIRAEPMPLPTPHIQTISGGFSIYPSDGETFQELFDRANHGLNEAKSGGRDGIDLGTPPPADEAPPPGKKRRASRVADPRD